MEEQERQMQRWDSYASKIDILTDYELWFDRPGRQQIRTFYRRWVRTRTILEIGCGAGHMITALTRDNPSLEITGLDLSQGMLTLAAAQGSRSLVCGSGNDLPFQDESFDTVIAAAWVFRYLSPERALTEVRRVLRPNGELLFDVPLFFGTALEAASEILRSPSRWRNAVQGHRLDLNPLSGNLWSSRLKASGFSLIRVAGVFEIPFFTHRTGFAPWIKNPFLRHFCLTLFHHARKAERAPLGID